MCLRYKAGFESEHEEQDHSLTEGFGSSRGEYHETSYQPSRSKWPAEEFLHAAYPNHPKIPRPTTKELSDQNNGMAAAYEGDRYGSQNETRSLVPGGRNPFATLPRRPSDDEAPVFHLDDDSTDYPIWPHDGTNDQPSSAEPQVPVDASRQLRMSQVVRKVNSGFQILAPGTFDAPIQNDAGRKEGVPGNKRHSRKLQKRSRANSYSIEEP